jgi:hypothetical protein
MNVKLYNQAIEMIQAELTKIINKHGPMVNLFEAYGVLLEEIDELGEEVKKKPENRNKEWMAKEAVQVAAVSVRTLAELFYDNPELRLKNATKALRATVGYYMMDDPEKNKLHSAAEGWARIQIPAFRLLLDLEEGTTEKNKAQLFTIGARAFKLLFEYCLDEKGTL